MQDAEAELQNAEEQRTEANSELDEAREKLAKLRDELLGAGPGRDAAMAGSAGASASEASAALTGQAERQSFGQSAQVLAMPGELGVEDGAVRDHTHAHPVPQVVGDSAPELPDAGHRETQKP